jgi:hypothetical protein
MPEDVTRGSPWFRVSTRLRITHSINILISLKCIVSTGAATDQTIPETIRHCITESETNGSNFETEPRESSDWSHRPRLRTLLGTYGRCEKQFYGSSVECFCSHGHAEKKQSTLNENRLRFSRDVHIFRPF